MIKLANQKLGDILNLNKQHMQKPTVNILLNGEMTSFLTTQEEGKNVPSHHCFTTVYWKTQRMQQDKKKNIDGIHIGDKEIELYLLAEDMAIYVENLRKSVKIFLEAVSDYIKDA